MNTHTSLRRPVRSLLLVAHLGLLAACSAGGGAEGLATPPSTSVDPAGDWNFFRDGLACSGAEFDAFPMAISLVSGNAFRVEIGAAGEVFEFEGTLAGDQLQVSGADTVGATTLEIQNAVWAFSSDQNSIQGVMNLLRTENGVGCQVDDIISAFRQDATVTSVARGEWDFIATTTAADGPCNEVGRVEILPVTFHPKRDNEFVFEVTTENGSRLQFEATFDGTTLSLGGSDSDASGELASVLPGSAVSIDPAGGFGAGTLRVGLGAACSFDFDVDAVRRSLGHAYMPYLEDMQGAQTLVGVDPTDPGVRVDLVASIGDADYAASPNTLTLSSFTARAARREYDAASRAVLGALLDTLYFRDGDDVLLVDLTARENALGQRVVPSPKVVFEGNGAPVFDLVAKTDLAGTMTVLSFVSGSARMLVEVDRAGNARSTQTAANGLVFGLTFDDDGRYAAAVVRSSNGDLFTQTVEGGSQLVRSEVSDIAVGVDGSFYLTRPGRVEVLEAGSGDVNFVRNVFGSTHRLGRPRGTTLCFTEEDGSSLRMFRTSPGGNASSVASTGDVPVSGGSPSDPLLVAERVITRHRAANGEVRLVSAPLSGGVFETLLSGAAADEFSTNSSVSVLAGRAFFNTVDGADFIVAALAPTGASPVEETLFGHRTIATLFEDSFALADGPAAQALIVVDANGADRNRLLSVDLATNPMGLLGSASLVFEPAIPGSSTRLELTGRQGLIADMSGSTPADPVAQIHFVDLGGSLPATVITSDPGSVSLPIN